MGMWKWIFVLALALGAGAMLCASARQEEPGDDNLILNADFAKHTGNGIPTGYTLAGSARYQFLGDPRRDMSSVGVALQSNGGSGSVSQTVGHLAGHAGQSYRFSVYALPQDTFAVCKDSLVLKVEFLGADGVKSYDVKTKSIYPLIEKARHDLSANGVRHIGGAAVWTTYTLDFVIPFPEVDQLRLSVAFDNGAGSGSGSGDFYVSKFALNSITTASVDAPSTQPTPTVDQSHLIPIGGRWYYAANDGETSVPTEFDYRNADRLLYHDDRYSAPFAGMMTSVLRAGEKDSSGAIAMLDRVIDDNVVIHFQSDALVIHSRGLPNHPTGKFPESGSGRGSNPNYIAEQDETFYLPVDPQINPRHFVTDAHNTNRALPMGPIGIAVNGIVFFNPFDMGNTDATDMMDRCCGHPNQFGMYHYHKYPICLNSPWSDRGEDHSPLIGFAFDGFPIYGPYESAGVMAKDEVGDKALNAFNMHYDAQRGWHYHVTPGKFPYIIGGYWGTEDPQDRQRPKRPGGSNGGPDGNNGGGPMSGATGVNGSGANGPGANGRGGSSPGANGSGGNGFGVPRGNRPPPPDAPF